MRLAADFLVLILWIQQCCVTTVTARFTRNTPPPTGTTSTTETAVTSVLPNEQCVIYRWPSQLSCPGSAFSGDPLRIPGNFDISRIPLNTTSLRLGARQSNILSPDAEPLTTDLSLLEEIKFEYFEGPDGQSAAIGAFLVNVKHTIKIMYIYYSKIGNLGATFLRGFSSLRVLDLSMSDIAAIHVDAFDTRLSGEASPAPLQNIVLLGNHIESLDWAVFAPVAANLTSINVASQKRPLKAITHSKNFTFGQPLFSVNLEGNVTFPPRSVLDSLNLFKQSTISFGNNFVCPNATPDCACCASYTMASWAYEVALRDPSMRPWLRFHCGTVPFGREWSFGGFSSTIKLPALAHYAKCIEETPDSQITEIATAITGIVTTDSAVASTVFPTAAACQETQPIVIQCTKGNVTFSQTNFDQSDALRIEIYVDNTLKCRLVLRDMHKWILKQQHKLEPVHGSPHINVQCDSHSGLVVSSDDPELSEADTLVYATGVNVICRSIFLSFLKAFLKQFPLAEPAG